MRRVLSILAVAIFVLSVAPVFADERACVDYQWSVNPERCKQIEERNDRFKLSFGWLPVSPGGALLPDADASFRRGWGMQRWYNAYIDEYLIPNGAPRQPYFHNGAFTRCCREDTLLFQSNNFRGKPGDTYHLWGRRGLDSFEERGPALGASLEYRIVGGLWGSLTYQQSRQTVAWTFEEGEYLTITGVERFYAQERFNFSDPVPYWYVDASRHRYERKREHKRNLYQFSALAKYDLTRGNRHWSVMPQAGADLTLVRERDYTTLQLYDWRIFGGDRPTEVSWDAELDVAWSAKIRPVAGLTLELWPDRKFNGLGIVVDGRHFFDEAWVSSVHGDGFLKPYFVDTHVRAYTVSVSGIVRF